MPDVPPSFWRHEITDQVLTIEIPMKPSGSLAIGADDAGLVSVQLLDGQERDVRRLTPGFRIGGNDVVEWICDGISVARKRGSVLVRPTNNYAGHVDALELLWALEIVGPGRKWIG